MCPTNCRDVVPMGIGVQHGPQNPITCGCSAQPRSLIVDKDVKSRALSDTWRYTFNERCPCAHTCAPHPPYGLADRPERCPKNLVQLILYMFHLSRGCSHVFQIIYRMFIPSVYVCVCMCMIRRKNIAKF